MTLLETQLAFQAYVLRDGGDDLATRVRATGTVDARQRLGVYHFAYRARMSALLREAFDKTWTYLGDARFDEAVAAYVAEHVSASPSLDDYGSGFADLLARQMPNEPDAAELAWLDWSMRRVFDGPDAEAVTASRLASLSAGDWDRARLVLHPTLVLRTVTANVGALWASLDAGTPAMPPPLDEPMMLRVWRKGLQPHFRTIPAAEGAMLERLEQGESFAAVCEALAGEGTDDPTESAAAFLGAWLTDELIVDVIL